MLTNIGLKKQGSVYSQHQDSLKNDFKGCLLQAEKPVKDILQHLQTTPRFG